jgi:hypothetical protein
LEATELSRRTPTGPSPRARSASGPSNGPRGDTEPAASGPSASGRSGAQRPCRKKLLTGPRGPSGQQATRPSESQWGIRKPGATQQSPDPARRGAAQGGARWGYSSSGAQRTPSSDSPLPWGAHVGLKESGSCPQNRHKARNAIRGPRASVARKDKPRRTRMRNKS